MSRSGRYTVRKDGLHEAIRVIDGKRKAFRGKTDAEVERKMIAYRGELKTGRSFSVIADEWAAVHFPTLSQNTLKGYKVAKKRAISYFGELSIKSITPPEIKQMLNSLARQNFSQKVISNERLILNLIFTFAVEESGDLDVNPCISVKPPKGKKRVPREAASEADENIIKQSAKIWLLPTFIMYTGMRKGEALATRGVNINLDELTITVTHSVFYENDKAYLKAPKTGAGVRTLPILDLLLPLLPSLSKGAFLFSNDGGKSPLSAYEYNREYKSYKEKTGITATAHMIRHSYATLLFECDVESKDAQGLMGHATKAMTDDIYTHIRDSRKQKITDRINDRLKS